MNDGINSESCSLSYIKVDDAVRAIVSIGEGAMLAKVDIKSAYRIIPVHPEDRLLLGMRWREALYVDSALEVSTKNFQQCGRYSGMEAQTYGHSTSFSLSG